MLHKRALPPLPTWLVLGVVLVGALILRLVALDTPLWGDEVASWAFARRQPFMAMWQYAAHDPTPPLYYAILHFSIRFLGDTIVALRLPSVAFSMLTLPVVYGGMQQAQFGRGASSWAVVLAATSSMLIFYAQEARSYALLALLGTLATVLLFRCSQQPKGGNYAAYTVVVVALLLTHRYGFFLVGGHLLFVIITQQRRLVLVILGLLGCAGLVLVTQILTNSFSYGGAGDPLDLRAIVSLFAGLAGGTLGLQYIAKMPNGPLLGLPLPWLNQLAVLLGIVLLAASLWVAVRTVPPLAAKQRQFLGLLATSILVPISLGCLAGSPLSPRPQWLLRGLIYIWPLWAMLVAAVLERYAKRVLILGLLVGLNGCALYPYYTNYERWSDRPAFEQLNQRVSAQDLIVVDPWYMHDFVDYYYHGSAPMVGWSEDLGWLDVEQMQRNNQFRLLPLDEVPAPKGDVYVFYRTDQVAWFASTPFSQTLVYDPTLTAWRAYTGN